MHGRFVGHYTVQLMLRPCCPGESASGGGYFDRLETSVEWRHITDYEGPCTHAGVTPWRRQTWLAKLAADRLTCLAYDVP